MKKFQSSRISTISVVSQTRSVAALHWTQWNECWPKCSPHPIFRGKCLDPDALAYWIRRSCNCLIRICNSACIRNEFAYASTGASFGGSRPVWKHRDWTRSENADTHVFVVFWLLCDCGGFCNAVDRLSVLDDLIIVFFRQNAQKVLELVSLFQSWSKF
jgi:hypothetical protein